MTDRFHNWNKGGTCTECGCSYAGLERRDPCQGKTPAPAEHVVPAGTVVGLIDWNGTKASVIDAVLEARSAVYTQPAELSVGGEPVAEIVTATTPAAEILFGRDIKFLVDQRDIPIGTKLYAAPAELSVGETFTREQMLAEVDRRVERALAAREALAPVELLVGIEDRCTTYEDILRVVCGHLELPQSESGPADDVRLYDRALEAMDEYSKKADADLAENTRLRFKAEAQVFQLRKALAEIGDGFVAAKDAPAAHDEAVKIARAALSVSEVEG